MGSGMDSGVNCPRIQRHGDAQHSINARRFASGNEEPSEGSEAMPNNGDPVDTHLIEEALYHTRLTVKGVSRRIPSRVAEAEEIQRVRAVRDGGLLHGRHPVAPCTDPAMQKNHRTAPSEGFVVDRGLVDKYNAHAASGFALAGPQVGMQQGMPNQARQPPCRPRFISRTGTGCPALDLSAQQARRV